MADITTAGELKGKTLRIILNDGQPRDLDFDFEAQCVIEETMRNHGLKPDEEQARMLKEEAAKAKALEDGVDYIPTINHDGPGYFRSMGIFAYALTASWREDNGEGGMTFAQFKRLLPIRPASRTKAWTDAVTAAMASETDESPNAPAPAEDPLLAASARKSRKADAASASVSPPTGISSGTAAEPSSESRPSESSGA